jgi:hypothetical protein
MRVDHDIELKWLMGQDRLLYRDIDSGYWRITGLKNVTVDERLVKWMVGLRMLRPSYRGMTESYTLGRTIDLSRTMYWRRKLNSDVTLFVGEEDPHGSS